jgi:hypothetical protein
MRSRDDVDRKKHEPWPPQSDGQRFCRTMQVPCDTLAFRWSHSNQICPQSASDWQAKSGTLPIDLAMTASSVFVTHMSLPNLTLPLIGVSPDAHLPQV